MLKVILFLQNGLEFAWHVNFASDPWASITFWVGWFVFQVQQLQVLLLQAHGGTLPASIG